MKNLRSIAIIFGSLTLFSPAAQAAILPSFGIEYCTWDATHIVEVTQGINRDGVCTVLVSWKGDLKKDDVLRFPELRDFAGDDQRRIFVFRETKVPSKRVTHVSGLRMVLFLKKGTKGLGAQEQVSPWHGASWGRDVKTSVAWLDGGEVFAFVQIMNPGGQVVWPLGLTEKQFKERVLHINQTKEKLRQAVEVKDSRERAESLANLVRGDLSACQREAVAALSQCGENGLPTVRKLLKEKSPAWVTQDLIRAMGKIGGPVAGRELVALLKDEFAFWKARGPKLTGDWWHDWSLGQKEVYILRDRKGYFNAIIGALGQAKYPECRPLVREVHDFLKANPHLITSGGYAMDWCRVILAEK